jgi:hypothetical protein
VTFIHVTYTDAVHVSQKTLHLDYKEALVLCSEIIAVYCGLENPAPYGGTFIVATAKLTLLPLLFLVILCISFPESSVLALLAFNAAEPSNMALAFNAE